MEPWPHRHRHNGLAIPILGRRLLWKKDREVIVKRWCYGVARRQCHLLPVIITSRIINLFLLSLMFWVILYLLLCFVLSMLEFDTVIKECIEFCTKPIFVFYLGYISYFFLQFIFILSLLYYSFHSTLLPSCYILYEKIRV